MARFVATLTCRHRVPVIKRNAGAVMCPWCRVMRGVRSVGLQTSTGGGMGDALD